MTTEKPEYHYVHPKKTFLSAVLQKNILGATQERKQRMYLEADFQVQNGPSFWYLQVKEHRFSGKKVSLATTSRCF